MVAHPVLAAVGAAEGLEVGRMSGLFSKVILLLEGMQGLKNWVSRSYDSHILGRGSRNLVGEIWNYNRVGRV